LGILPILKTSNNGWLEFAGLVAHPVNAPLLGTWVKKPQSHADKSWTPIFGYKIVSVAHAAKDCLSVACCAKILPFCATCQAFEQTLVFDMPIPESKIKIV
jgi:hypothetical protein